eukprot:1350567-Prymnesium_polylepis.1
MCIRDRNSPPTPVACMSRSSAIASTDLLLAVTAPLSPRWSSGALVSSPVPRLDSAASAVAAPAGIEERECLGSGGIDERDAMCTSRPGRAGCAEA